MGDIHGLFCQDIGRGEGKDEPLKLLRTHPSMSIHFQTPNQELLDIGRKVFIVEDVINWLILDLPQKILLILGPPRRICKEHLVKYHPQGPNIALIRILILPQGFRCHIERTANIILTALAQSLYLNGKAEISNLNASIMREEDIGWFEIAMDDVLGVELEVALDDVLHVEDCLRVDQTLLDDLTEIRPAEFRDDVGVVPSGEDIA